MYAVTSMPLDRRTRATFRSAEFGFFGVIVFTTVHTPRFCGQPCMAGCFGFDRCGMRGARINWLIVGIPNLGLVRLAGAAAGKNSLPIRGAADRVSPMDRVIQ